MSAFFVTTVEQKLFVGFVNTLSKSNLVSCKWDNNVFVPKFNSKYSEAFSKLCTMFQWRTNEYIVNAKCVIGGDIE